MNACVNSFIISFICLIILYHYDCSSVFSKNWPKCSKSDLIRRPKTTVKAKNPSKCHPKQIFLQSFHHVIASSCMGSLLQRPKFIKAFALFGHAVKHMSVKCFYVKNVPNLIPKWTHKGPPEGPQNQPKWPP